MRKTGAVTGYPVTGGYQAVTTSAASARTASAVGGQTYWVVLFCDQDCHIAFGGATVVATTADFFLPASTNVMLAIRPGQSVAAIQSSAGGTLRVSELDH